MSFWVHPPHVRHALLTACIAGILGLAVVPGRSAAQNAGTNTPGTRERAGDPSASPAPAAIPEPVATAIPSSPETPLPGPSPTPSPQATASPSPSPASGQGVVLIPPPSSDPPTILRVELADTTVRSGAPYRLIVHTTPDVISVGVRVRGFTIVLPATGTPGEFGAAGNVPLIPAMFADRDFIVTLIARTDSGQSTEFPFTVHAAH